MQVHNAALESAMHANGESENLRHSSSGTAVTIIDEASQVLVSNHLAVS